MRKTALIILFVLASIQIANAKCSVSKVDMQAVQKAETAFRAEPSPETGAAFLNRLPDHFCQFHLMFGWIDDAPTPLYELPLQQTLPSLIRHVPATSLAKKYVRLASHAVWELDNINALQTAYVELFYDQPELVIAEILSLPNEEAVAAVRFLFDGYSPEKSFLDETEKQTLCRSSSRFCDLVNMAESQLKNQSQAQ